MPSSKLLKERIESIQDTMKITNAMYLISSSKLRKARKNYQNVSPYFNRMRDTISRVVPHLPEEPVHPFFHERNTANPKRAYIVLTADKGMAGSSQGAGQGRWPTDRGCRLLPAHRHVPCFHGSEGC